MSPTVTLDVRGKVSIADQITASGSNGLASAPAYSFAGDTNMGMFRPAADTLAFSTNSSEAIRIFSNGNVSIGSTTNSSKLRVDGQIMVVDGNQAAGKVLTSDANGLASWQTAPGAGGGTTILQATVNVNLPSIGATSCTAQTFTVTGAATGKTAWLSPATALTNRLLIAYTRVSAANTVEAKFCNESAAAIDMAAMDFYVSVIQ